MKKKKAKFKVDDLVVISDSVGIGLIVKVGFDEWCSSSYYQVSCSNSNHIFTIYESWVSKATDKDIIKYLVDLSCEAGGVKFDSITYPIIFGDDKIMVGCQRISLDDALDICDLIQSRVERKAVK